MMKPHPLSIFLTLGFLLLAGCAGGLTRPLPAETTTAYKGGQAYQESEGYLVGTLSLLGPPNNAFIRKTGGGDNQLYDAYHFYFRKIDAPSAGLRGDIGVSKPFGFGLNSKYHEDFAVEGGAGFAYCTPLPAGRYEFFQYQLFANGGTGSTTWTAQKEFSIPFEIKAGKALYIGEIIASMDLGRNLLGLRMPSGATFGASDELHRDKAILYKKHPFLIHIPIESFVIGPALNSHFQAEEDAAR